MQLLVAAILFSALPSPPGSGERSKKEAFLQDKQTRKEVHLLRVLAAAAAPVLTMHNVWTNETLPVVLPPPTAKGPAALPEPVARFDQLVRDHFTNQATTMDARLFGAVVRAAEKFHARYVEVVSGFRAPKYQLMLRKKGHEVARDSQHPRGTAIDFRVAGVPTRLLLRFVKSLHLGGVGYYPESKFVHADVGPIRFWRGH
ncbi:MAG: YcbK family protein [Polyangia bacterium]